MNDRKDPLCASLASHQRSRLFEIIMIDSQWACLIFDTVKT
ncbi:hypothetical protein [uncultured Parasutterella sp.]|nr:hypothetical protein [uncultured Parasutterella sp.]